MTLTTKVRDSLTQEFRNDLRENPGSRVLCENDDAGMVDLSIILPGTVAGKRWELALVTEIWDETVTPNGVGAYAIVDGGSNEYVGTVGEPDGYSLPPEVVTAANAMSERVHNLNLPLLVLEGKDIEMFADLHRIVTARNSGDEAALDQAIVAAAGRLAEAFPAKADEFRCEPLGGMAP